MLESLLFHALLIATLKELRYKLATAHTLRLGLRQGLLGTPGHATILLMNHLFEALPILYMHTLYLYSALALFVNSYCGD
jgi:hypothetical protein